MAVGRKTRFCTSECRHALNSPIFARLQLAAVAAAALGIEEQVVLAQQLADIRLQRDQIRGILGVAPDRQRPGHVLVNESERARQTG